MDCLLSCPSAAAHTVTVSAKGKLQMLLTTCQHFASKACVLSANRALQLCIKHHHHGMLQAVHSTWCSCSRLQNSCVDSTLQMYNASLLPQHHALPAHDPPTLCKAKVRICSPAEHTPVTQPHQHNQAHAPCKHRSSITISEIDSCLLQTQTQKVRQALGRCHLAINLSTNQPTTNQLRR